MVCPDRAGRSGMKAHEPRLGSKSRGRSLATRSCASIGTQRGKHRYGWREKRILARVFRAFIHGEGNPDMLRQTALAGTVGGRFAVLRGIAVQRRSGGIARFRKMKPHVIVVQGVFPPCVRPRRPHIRASEPRATGFFRRPHAQADRPHRRR